MKIFPDNKKNSFSNNNSAKDVYAALLTDYTVETTTLASRLRWLSFFRLISFCAFIFFGFKALQTGNSIFITLVIVSLIAFLILIRLYDKMQQRLSFFRALVRINKDEIDFISGSNSVYATGSEYTDPHHPYSYDLDLFGNGGLFGYLNRCSTSFGKQALANALLHPETKSIASNQEAIRELTPLLEFRQHLQAHGSLLDTKDKEMQQLEAWLKAKPSFDNKPFYYFLLLFPITTIGCLAGYLITENETLLNSFYFLFVVNLVIAASFSRTIYKHLSVSTSVTKVLQQFAGQLKQLEDQPFKSSLLQDLQAKLRTNNGYASISIARLASLFNYLETVVNLVVSMLLNGLFLFHIHILYQLEKWKKENGNRIMSWLELLGKAEALNSFANLAYNNPAFCMPSLSEKETLVAENMGHILIKSAKRVENSISFATHPFVILTGSNMSGKSTFLRTLGTNVVLARAGSVVCADRFDFFPYAVHVSMRITDSLQDSESFFYAELKRLHEIILQLEAGEKIFVILDEILRGTNSNDKHNGTIGLIRKLVAAKACGIIATHDLTVSRLQEESHGYISNKCFESEIINDELIFDYKLKDGVCTKLSASFLMKKWGIIS